MSSLNYASTAHVTYTTICETAGSLSFALKILARCDEKATNKLKQVLHHTGLNVIWLVMLSATICTLAGWAWYPSPSS